MTAFVQILLAKQLIMPLQQPPYNPDLKLLTFSKIEITNNVHIIQENVTLILKLLQNLFIDVLKNGKIDGSGSWR